MNLYSIADMTARIRNSQSIFKKEVILRRSKRCESILKLLEREGFIESFQISEAKPYEILVTFKYFEGKPVITTIKTVSRPGQRFYTNWRSLWQIKKFVGFYILSTSKGIVTDKEARRLKLGGEVLCFIV